MIFIYVICSILFIIVWLGISIYASVYWFQTPHDAIKKKSPLLHWTKKAVWWYGFYFIVIVNFVLFGSAAIVAAYLIIRNLNV